MYFFFLVLWCRCQYNFYKNVMERFLILENVNILRINLRNTINYDQLTILNQWNSTEFIHYCQMIAAFVVVCSEFFSDLKDFSDFRCSPNIENIIFASCWHFFFVYICVRDAEYTRLQFLFRISICACSVLHSICIYLNDPIPVGSIHKTQNVCMYTRKKKFHTPQTTFFFLLLCPFSRLVQFFSLLFFDTIQKRKEKIADWQKKRLF